MKTVIVGDIHGRSVWKLIYEMEKPDRLIFIGDYFDSFDIKGADQLSNFQDIIAFKESGKCEVIMLIGNHDHHYFPEVGDTGTSGYQHLLAPSIQYVVSENRHNLQMAYQMDEFLFTHAGVSSVFMDQVFGKGDWKVENLAIDLNEMFKYKPKTFIFGEYALMNKMSYLDPYGDSEDQSPIWIRPRALMRANRDTLRKEIIQIFGHTQVDQIDTKGGATGGRYYNIDVLGTSGEYMIINDNEVTFNTWKSKNA
jgi:predicted phosphodiesterase